MNDYLLTKKKKGFYLRDQSEKLRAGENGLFWPARYWPLALVSHKKGLFGHIINPLLITLNRSRWLVIDLVLFFFIVVLDFVLRHKNSKKELANIQLS